MPMERVAAMPLGLSTLRTPSRMANLPSRRLGRNRSWKRKRYRSRSYLHSSPPVGLVQALICSSMALRTAERSFSLMPFMSSS